MERYIVRIKLTILGPFLTAAASTESYGLDKAFYRVAPDKPAIPGSHIKGKLRMSLEELYEFSNAEMDMDLDTLFGKPSTSASYEPQRGLLSFSNFTCKSPQKPRKRTRTAINSVTLTASENQLREFEDLFPSGSSTDWQGYVTFFAKDDTDAQRVAQIVRLGFKWLATMGAEKGVGSGRLRSITVSEPEKAKPMIESDLTAFASSKALHLLIQPEERLLIGGIKRPRANFLRSERVIPGSVIKGALATSLNQAYGVRPSYMPLSAETGKQMPEYRLLAEYYDCIRVSHAFPVVKGEKRPVKIPLSTVEVNKKFYDLALSEATDLLIEGQAPLYSIDWKTPHDYFGTPKLLDHSETNERWDYFDTAKPKEVFVTRTSIDDATRRSLDGQLFTYTFLCPEDYHEKPVQWVCNVDFSRVEDENIQSSVRDQFNRAVSAYLCRLGKLNQPVAVEVLPEFATPTMTCHDAIHEGHVIVTLQSDAVMLDPSQVQQLAPGDDLKALYSAYWEQLSGKDGKPPCLELVDFFAQQNFQGGYLYHRYLGAGERGKGRANYYPYYLTGAGSVFVLHAVDETAARSCLQQWVQKGLDLPAWAKELYSKNERAIWQNCPFVPENGYGEIIVNLKWHWEKLPLTSSESKSFGGE